MIPKFDEGQRVTNIYLGVTGTVGTVWADVTPPRYDVVYDTHEGTYTATESVLSGDMSEPFGVPAVQASIIGLDQLVEAAAAARVVGVLTNYQLERIWDMINDARHALYQRASAPTEYL